MIIIGWGSYTTSGIFGDIMALIVALGMGFSMVLVRFYKEKDLVWLFFNTSNDAFLFAGM